MVGGGDGDGRVVVVANGAGHGEEVGGGGLVWGGFQAFGLWNVERGLYFCNTSLMPFCDTSFAKSQ